MAWYDPTSWDLSTDADRMNQQRSQQLTQLGTQAAGNYGTLAGQLGTQAQALNNQANGQGLVSSQLLQQGNQQALAAQRSLAASANPQNAAMAARNAAMNMGRLQYGLSGQQAVAGTQEANMARQALTQMLLQQRQQELQAALQGLNPNVPQGAVTQGLMGALGGAAAAAPAAIAASDRRLKRDVDSGDKDAGKALKHLRAFAFDYKDDRHGKGRQFGVMAQDMERAGLGHAVIDTPAGKMVHGARAATSALALTAALAKRVSKLEGGK